MIISQGILRVEVEGDYVTVPAIIGGTWSSIRRDRVEVETPDHRVVERSSDTDYWREYIAAATGANQ